jgi:4-azaleucine resistance transporter AzlC
LGSGLSFDVQGLDFVMTALFVAIFVEQWRAPRNRLPGLAGLSATALCLWLFGPGQFILPAMALLIAGLSLGRRALEKGAAA